MESWIKLMFLCAVIQLAVGDISKPILNDWPKKAEVCAGVECGIGERCIVGEDNMPKCVCGQTCTQEYSPLCATNGRTYSNLCTMEVEACLNGVRLDVIMYKDCKFVFACGGAIIGLAVITVILLIILIVRCCQRRRAPRRMAFIIDDYTSEAFYSHSDAIYKPTTIKSKKVAYDKIPILSN